jgi:hypothetical protein
MLDHQKDSQIPIEIIVMPGIAGEERVGLDISRNHAAFVRPCTNDEEVLKLAIKGSARGSGHFEARVRSRVNPRRRIILETAMTSFAASQSHQIFTLGLKQDECYSSTLTLWSTSTSTAVMVWRGIR